MPVEAPDRCRLAVQRAPAGRTRDPVECVLQLTRDRAVVLGRCDQHRIGVAHCLAQCLGGVRAAGRVEVLVVGRDLAQPFELDQLHPSGQPLGGGPQQGRVERALPQAAGDTEHPHRYSPSSTSSSSTAISTA
jgi:hypothetical protein